MASLRRACSSKANVSMTPRSAADASLDSSSSESSKSRASARYSAGARSRSRRATSLQARTRGRERPVAGWRSAALGGRARSWTYSTAMTQRATTSPSASTRASSVGIHVSGRPRWRAKWCRTAAVWPFSSSSWNCRCAGSTRSSSRSSGPGGMPASLVAKASLASLVRAAIHASARSRVMSGSPRNASTSSAITRPVAACRTRVGSARSKPWLTAYICSSGVSRIDCEVRPWAWMRVGWSRAPEVTSTSWGSSSR